MGATSLLSRKRLSYSLFKARKKTAESSLKSKFIAVLVKHGIGFEEK
jgi:hypothetical protein